MAVLSLSLLASFRHQLFLEHIEVLDEFEYEDTTLFALRDDDLTFWQIERLYRICKFSVLLLYCKGDKKIHLRLYHDD